MFNVWINKTINDFEEKSNSIENAQIFNLFDKNNKSNVKSDAEQLWRRFGCQSLSNINEDLLIIAISVFCADKRMQRKKSTDNWTRTIKLHIPVLEYKKWMPLENELSKMLNFLSGDNWSIKFRKSDCKYRANKKNTKYKLIDKGKLDSVSLFSGGLDSFCGALTLANKKRNTCFVGFREYNLLTSRQNELFNAINDTYPELNKELLLFNANPLAPIQEEGKKVKGGGESTSRSRSFLFLAGALAIASIVGEDVPVYIPENGFIGINVPLTDSRSGSCSTRTTHPIFLKSLNNILHLVGIKNRVSNFYWDKSKGEIVNEHKENNVFKQSAHRTLSCSHPCLSRYDKIAPPCNCGYCYPCLIRRASFIATGKDETTYNKNYKINKDFIAKYNNIQGKASDLKGVLFSLRRYLLHKDDKEYIRALLLRQGPLSGEEIHAFERLYHQSMAELLAMIKFEDGNNGSGLIDYLGVKGVLNV